MHPGPHPHWNEGKTLSLSLSTSNQFLAHHTHPMNMQWIFKDLVTPFTIKYPVGPPFPGIPELKLLNMACDRRKHDQRFRYLHLNPNPGYCKSQGWAIQCRDRTCVCGSYTA